MNQRTQTAPARSALLKATAKGSPTGPTVSLAAKVAIARAMSRRDQKAVPSRIRTAPTAQRSNSEPFYELLFTQDQTELPKRERALVSGWAVPATGGHWGGRLTGDAMATDFLKFLRQQPGSTEGQQCSQAARKLITIVQSLACRIEQEGGTSAMSGGDQDSASALALRGQYIAFFESIGGWLQAAVKHLGEPLDMAAEADLIEQMNAGASFDQADAAGQMGVA